MDDVIMHTETENTGFVLCSESLRFSLEVNCLSLQGPNDETSSSLQDLAHHMYLMTLEGRLHLAPLQNPHNILDGTYRFRAT